MSHHIIYPIGYQSFEKLRRENALYVDKTEYVYQLVLRPACYFLSRPRRFGKSLLLSTLEAYFLGKSDLFAGLKISEHDIEWKEYPVLHFDFSRTNANIEIDELTRLWVTEDSLSDKYDSARPIPLLFQTGYLTIKDYEDGYYLLDIPNGEVRNALVKELMPEYMGVKSDEMRSLVTKLGRYVRNGDVELMLQEIKFTHSISD